MKSLDPLEVVFVCTGNRARSPLAAGLFRVHAAAYGATASSCGTVDVGPVPALPLAIESAGRLGVELISHSARPLGALDLDSADLVVGFELSHVVAAVTDGGSRPERTFLLGELVRLLDRHVYLEDNVHDSARARIGDADMRRVRSRPALDAAVVADPIGKPASIMERTATEIDMLVRQLVGGLFGSPWDEPVRPDPRNRRRWLRRGR